MALSSGSRLGPYEIESALGSGGMGEVYKARDTRLDRTVAIKVLPEAFAADPERRERFEREARAVAALNHPHICNLHDVGESAEPNPVRFLVMEYLEGQTLADRLVRGPLPTPELFRYAIELADALDHAHKRSLVHRDLKPGNVMLTRAGAKLLDFGLSRLQTIPDLLSLSTISPGGAPLTAQGAVLGTYPYMAPEQLAGHEADARSDIFAFGAMVHEMATGRRAFDGATAATLIGAILHTDPPPLSTLQPLTPPALDRLVSRCLAKDPDDRWQTARDLMLELKWIAEHAARLEPVSARVATRSFGLMVSTALAVAAIAAAGLTVAYVLRARAEDSPVRLSFLPPAGLTLADITVGGPVTISPDGNRLAFVATGPDGVQSLYIRALDSPAAQALPGTDDAAYPFWSPDGRFIGFFAQGKLRKIQLSGGPVQTLCDAIQPRGGSWNRDAMIVFSAEAGHELYQVSAGGGGPTPVPADGKNVERYWPSFLPDGRHFVYFARPQKHGIYVAALDAPEATLLLPDYVSVVYATSGHLLALIGSSRSAARGTLMAVPFDATSLQITGEPSPIAEGIGYSGGHGLRAFSVSANGTLVYGTIERPAGQLIWFDRSGKPLRNIGSAGYSHPAISLDGRFVVAERLDPATQAEDLWLLETTRGLESRFTSAQSFDTGAIWSPDGTRIVFMSPRGTPPNLFLKAVSGTGPEERLFRSNFNSQATDWSHDGRTIVYASLHPKTRWDLWLLPMTGPPGDRKPVPFLQTDSSEHQARFSPDGRWLAYTSDESESAEVYVREFPKPGTQVQISTNGGRTPRWRGDGKELFYLAADGTLMAVSVEAGRAFKVSTPAALFKTRIADRSGLAGMGHASNYASTHDGLRFLVSTAVGEHRPDRTTIVLNWPAALAGR